jgi:hypothetical protein
MMVGAGVNVEGIGAGDRNRTYDLRVTSALLYRLSYTGIGVTAYSEPRAIIALGLLQALSLNVVASRTSPAICPSQDTTFRFRSQNTGFCFQDTLKIIRSGRHLT